MLKQRIITALWGVPLLLAVIWFGEPWFSLVMAAATSLGALEFYRMAAHSQKQPLATFGIIWSLLFLLSPHISDPRVMPLLLASAITIPPIWLALRPPRQNFIYNYAWTVAGILYLGWALSHYVALRDTSQGMEWVLFVVLSTFACDTSAFFIGRAWGKHHLAPRVSPGKTWEGAVGGLVGAVGASFILALIFEEWGTGLPLTYWHIALLASLIGIFAQLGDLLESGLKRITQVKNSGRCLPGHGGILDRLDSIIFTGVVVYYYVTWFAA